MNGYFAVQLKKSDSKLVSKRAIFPNLVSVYLIAAGGSPSMDPKFPCPDIKGKLIENS